MLLIGAPTDAVFFVIMYENRVNIPDIPQRI